MGKVNFKRFEQPLLNSISFVIGIVVTILLTKYSNIIIPDAPVVVKELSDTVVVVHEYRVSGLDDSFGQPIRSHDPVKNDKENTSTLLKPDAVYLESLENDKRIADSLISLFDDNISKHNQRYFKPKYNELINKSVLFPNSKGYSTVLENSTDFEFTCPSDSISEFIDLELAFFDESLIDNIACLYLHVIEIKEFNGKDAAFQLFSQAYKVRNGRNLIRIRNYLKTANTAFSIGYFLKNDMDKKSPGFHKIKCP